MHYMKEEFVTSTSKFNILIGMGSMMYVVTRDRLWFIRRSTCYSLPMDLISANKLFLSPISPLQVDLS